MCEMLSFKQTILFIQCVGIGTDLLLQILMTDHVLFRISCTMHIFSV